RRAGVTREVLRDLILRVALVVVRMQSANEPAALPLRFEPAIGELLPVRRNLLHAEELLAGRVEHHRREVVVEQHPLAVAVGFPFEEHLERVVPVDADAAPAAVPEPRLHLRDPLTVRRTAQTIAVAEKPGPVLARARVA